MSSLIQHLRNLALVLSLAGLVSGYLGWLHPVGDLLAPFRMIFAGIALVAALPWRRTRALCAALVVTAIAVHLWNGRGEQDVPPEENKLIVYQKNLLRYAVDRRPLIADIRTTAPDLLMLQEVSNRNRFVIDSLRDILPYSLVCGYIWNGNAVLSRYPFVPGSDACMNEAARVQVETPLGRIWAISLHPPWPWPKNQPEVVAELSQWLTPSTDPMVITGDFNAVAWSYALARIERATNTRRIGAYFATFYFDPSNIFGIGIDHVLANQALNARVVPVPQFNSDHLGLVATLWRS